MKLILFDLANTLESGGVLLPGARDLLEAIGSLRSGGQPAALLGLVSDFYMPSGSSDVDGIQQRYYRLLDDLGIRQFFEPVEERVTLSTEVGVFEPDEAIFRAAIGKASPGLEPDNVLFVTENLDHVLAARHLGLAAVHVSGPGQPQGGAVTLPELLPRLRDFVNSGEPVEVVVLDVPPGAGDGVPYPVAASEARWTRLGDVLVVRSPAARAGQRPAGDEAAVVRSLSVPEQHLHLVTQIGRLFQKDHPGIRVLVDKGRYLVVDFDPVLSPPLDGLHGSCYAVRPLPADTAVFDQRAARPRDSSSRAGRVGVPADTLSRTAFEHDVGRLARLWTRHSRSAGFLDALEWAEGRLADLGYATQVQTVAVPGGMTRNLIADRPGDGQDRELVLVTAHLDSVNVRGPAAAAPGADDNASGSAGVLAIGQALAAYPGRHDLRLILFGGEEQGLFGSRHYVNGLDATERARISAVVNMDMIACRNTSNATVLLEGAAVSQGMIDALADIAGTHTALSVQTSLNPFNSDHVPFLDLGIPAVLTIEGADSANDRVHTERDTLATLDIDLALEILRMNVMFVAQALAADTRPAGPTL